MFSNSLCHAWCPLDHWYSKSRELPWWKDTELEAKLKGLFAKYLTERRDRRIVLRGKESKRPLVTPYTTRFDGNYPKKVKIALRGVHIKSTLLTLTCDPKRFENVVHATQELNVGWDRIRNQVKEHFGKLSYLCVTEFSQNHNLPHLHIILSDNTLHPCRIKWLRNLWDKHVAHQLNVEQIRNVGAVNYVLKYLNKTFDGDGNAIADGKGAFYWLTNTKFYSLSADLQPEPTDEEIASGLIEELSKFDEIDIWINEEAYEYIGVCRAESSKAPPDVRDNKWLYAHHWDYNSEFEYWVSPDLMDLI
jgi:hypothetical protein